MVACRQKKHPLRLAFRAREGCVDREPLRLAIRAREGLVVACRQKKYPLHLAFRAREGCVDKESPSVSQFEQGRGWWCVDKRNTPSVSRFERGRDVLTERTPPSRNSSEGGVGGGVSTEETPLRLAFRAREGCVDRESPSVSQFKRGRGWWCVDKRNPPSVSRFERGRGVLTENPSVSQFKRGRGRRGWMQQHDEERCLSLRRVGSVVVSKLN